MVNPSVDFREWTVGDDGPTTPHEQIHFATPAVDDPHAVRVTLVSFAIMQLAPGDPLLSDGDAQGGAREASRESYLVQKRNLGLDKPALLNFNGFRDYGPSVTAAAYFLGRSANKSPRSCGCCARQPTNSDAGRRRQFLENLKIPNFVARLAVAGQHTTLAQTIVVFAQVWWRKKWTSALPATMKHVGDRQLDVATRRGALHVLNHASRHHSSTPTAVSQATPKHGCRRRLEVVVGKTRPRVRSRDAKGVDVRPS